MLRQVKKQQNTSIQGYGSKGCSEALNKSDITYYMGGSVSRQEVHMATTLDMATYLDCLNVKRKAERECPTSVLQMTGCLSQYF